MLLTQEQIEQMLATSMNIPSNFAFASGMTVTKIVEGRAEGVLNVRENSLNPSRNVHGGALMTLADTVSGCLVYASHGIAVTTSASIDFLRAAKGDQIRCVSTPIKMGRTLCVIHSDLYDNSDKLVATTTMTFLVMNG